ncbi:MAG: anaerobic ribonucleoside-triphosphate reductase activating protein [Holosporaceae bacterium]|jgi:anaerobic ribonucleoside-triphosphate reductase activating protein|nr:anaerobic ribonucleoside-triphosphate reductase activating protein [Holosporaceae bacterium]
MALNIGGLVSFTTVDYPSYFAAVVFLQGCCWRCSYCHNPHLQMLSADGSISWEDILNLLRKRINLLEALVFSGGEPLLQELLPDAVADVKRLGLLVGLHTAGAEPGMLAKVVSQLDWVGFDVKCRFDEYAIITGIEGSGAKAKKSLKILLDSGTLMEVRITLCTQITAEKLMEIIQEISNMGVKGLVLQKCRDKNENIVEHPVFSDKLFLRKASAYFDRLETR